MTVFDSIAADYDAWYDNEGKLAFEIELRALQDLLLSLPKPWLEVGVGSGRFAQALGIETGIDPSAKLLEIAMRRGIRGHLGVGEDMPFEEESFGTAFLIVMRCFADKPAEVIKGTHRVLKADGKLVIGTMLRTGPWAKFYLKLKAEGDDLFRHAHFLSHEELLKMLKQSGFSTEKTISTLFQGPGEVKKMELPQEAYFVDAGFTVIVARKTPL